MTLRRYFHSATDVDSILISAIVSILILLGFLQSSDLFLHWFVIPTTLCGILIGTDAVKWFRNRLNLLDPVGIIGLLGFHFFFLVPLLHVSWDVWQPYVNPPADWRTWLGLLSILNSIGLLIYRFCCHSIPCSSRGTDHRSSQSVQSSRLVAKLGWSPPCAGAPTLKNNNASQSVQSSPTVWQVDQRRFPFVLSVALTLSAALQVWVYQQFGGILAYINTATGDMTTAAEAFTGMGILFTLSESFPTLAIMGFAVYARNHKKLQTFPVLILVLILFLGLQLLFGGLRGSRSNTIWALFVAVAILHFWVRSISKQTIALGLIFLVGFMYVYGFFKAGGIESVQRVLESDASRAAIEQESGRTWDILLLQDLGRSDIQAFLLYRMMRPDNDYEYAWGRTYAAGLSILVPRSIWPDRPASKVKEGTEAKYGLGSYAPGLWQASNVYGLAGEAMLNFGPIAVPLSFILLGLLVRQIRYWLLVWQPFDTRTFMLPLLVNFCVVVLTSDLDNILFGFIKGSMLPFIVIVCGSNVHQHRSRSPDEC